MKHLMMLVVLLCVAITPCWAGFNEGKVAYARGDYAIALSEFLPLALQGHMAAQCQLGYMYHAGQGVSRDHAEAAKWYQRAAEQGMAAAQRNLGTMYEYGMTGVPRDYIVAAQWYRKAAEQGDPRAQYALGTMYDRGIGVPQSFQEALTWYRRAAELGVVEAQEMLSGVYTLGVPGEISKDNAKAVYWERRAAEQGNAKSMGMLGIRYEFGDGVPKDLVQAYMWYNLAVAYGNERDGGHDSARRYFVGKELTAAERAEAERRAVQFTPRPEIVPVNAECTP